MADSDQLIARSHIDLEERVRRRAHEIWLSHPDRTEDTALNDWLQAERDVLGPDPHSSAQNRGTVVGDAHARQGPPRGDA